MKFEWKTCIRAGISIFVVYLGIHYWGSVSGFLMSLLGAAGPLLVGGVIAYLVNILMSCYERHFFPKSRNRALVKSRRPLCMLAAFITLVGIVALVITMIVPQLIDCIRVIIAAVPRVIAFLVDKVDNLEWVPQEVINSISFEKLEGQIEKMVTVFLSGIGGAMNIAISTVTSVFSSMISFFIGLIFSFYILLSKDRLSEQFDRVMETYLKSSWYGKLKRMLQVLNDCFHRYIVGQCIEAVILGTLCTIGMLILRLPYATMIGPLVAVTALIPVAGAYIGAGVGAFMILTVSPFQAVVFLVFLVILQQLEGNLIYPKVVGTSIGLPGIWVLAAVTVGGSLMGIFGMILAVPLAAAAYRLLREDVRRRKIKVVLFDLDGTLLPMDQDQFVKKYFGLLVKKMEPYGYDEEEMTKALWSGVSAMVKNDGKETNEDVFWDVFSETLGERVFDNKEVFEEFYKKEFQKARNFCGYSELAGTAIYTAKKKGLRVALATNPLFPEVATRSRISWAGLKPEDFEVYTTYEESHYCKPNPEYFRELLQRLSVSPEDCLMVGNDAGEDMVAEEMGMKVFLLTDCLINKEGKDLSAYPQGDFYDLIHFIEEL